MSFYDALSLPDGKVAFEGTVRLDTGGAHVFRMDLPNRYPMYGVWRMVATPDRNKWNVEILKFGYLSKNNVGNPHPEAANPLTTRERKAAEELVRALFATPEIRNKGYPFKPDGRGFLGGVVFAENWVRQADD
jgi:hypothetical protein